MRLLVTIGIVVAVLFALPVLESRSSTAWFQAIGTADGGGGGY